MVDLPTTEIIEPIKSPIGLFYIQLSKLSEFPSKKHLYINIEMFLLYR